MITLFFPSSWTEQMCWNHIRFHFNNAMYSTTTLVVKADYTKYALFKI